MQIWQYFDNEMAMQAAWLSSHIYISYSLSKTFITKPRDWLGRTSLFCVGWDEHLNQLSKTVAQ